MSLEEKNDEPAESAEQLQMLRDLLEEQAQLKRRIAWTVRALRATDGLSWRTIAKATGLSIDQVRWMGNDVPAGTGKKVTPDNRPELTIPEGGYYDWTRGVTVSAAARQLGVSRPAVYARIDAKRYSTIQTGDRQLVSVDDDGKVIDNLGLKPDERTR